MTNEPLDDPMDLARSDAAPTTGGSVWVLSKVPPDVRAEFVRMARSWEVSAVALAVECLTRAARGGLIRIPTRAAYKFLGSRKMRPPGA